MRKNWANSFVSQGEHENKSTGGIGPRGFGKHSANGIRSSKNAGMAVPPRGTPIPQNYTEKYSLQKVVVRYDPTSTNDAEDLAFHVFVYTPSNRLICTVQVFFETDAIGLADPTFAIQPTWSIIRMAVNSKSGKETPLSQFYPTAGNANLPDEVIIPDAPELMRLNINAIDHGQFVGNVPFLATGINLVIQAKWEPDVETIPAVELKRLYERCRIDTGEPPIIQNGGA